MVYGADVAFLPRSARAKSESYYGYMMPDLSHSSRAKSGLYKDICTCERDVDLVSLSSVKSANTSDDLASNLARRSKSLAK